jgi:hypothetical protein
VSTAVPLVERPERAPRGRHARFVLELANDSDTLWLARSDVKLPARAGAAGLIARFGEGARLVATRLVGGQRGDVVLPRDLAPGERLRFPVFVELPPRLGDYEVDLVIASEPLPAPSPFAPAARVVVE